MQISAYILFKLLCLWAASSSVIILLFIKSGWLNTTVFALKDVGIYLIYFFGLQLFFTNKREKKLLLICFYFIFLVYILINYYTLSFNYSSPLNNIRQIFSPIVLIFIFSSLALNGRELDKSIKLLIFIFIFIFGFGLLEMSFSLWEKFDLKQFFNLKGIPTNEFGLSYMFYEPLIGYRERMTSTILDPISLGHFFASLIILFYYYKKKVAKPIYFLNINFINYILVLSVLGLVATFSKGAMLQAFIGVILLNSRIHLMLRLLFTLLPFSIFIFIPKEKLVGIYIHLNGFLNSIESLSLFGHGLGSVGNYAKMFSTDLTLYHQLGISDTFFGSLLGQLGLFGAVFWLILCLVTIFKLSNSLSGGVVAIKIFTSQFIVSALSENTMNVTSLLLPCCIILLAQNINFSNDKVNRYET